MEILSQRARRLLPSSAALVCWTALLLQFHLSIQWSIVNGDGVLHGVWMYLAFFTVLTNLLVAAVLTLPLIAPRTRMAALCAHGETIAGVSVNILLVCVAYNLLLRQTWSPQGPQWVADELLHDVVPLMFLAHALLVTPDCETSFLSRIRWATWPVAFFVYAMLRGAATGFYPYPFINVAVLGYAGALFNAIGILIGYFVLASLLSFLERTLRRPAVVE